MRGVIAVQHEASTTPANGAGAAGWGSIFLATRLEKTVSSKFVQVWMDLVTKGLRPGDRAFTVRNMVAHKSLNAAVRMFLKSPCDSFLSLDSDADVPPEFVERFRVFEPGWDYDILQAFYTRRGWPPRAIWLKRDALGQLTECVLMPGEGEDSYIADVDVAGTHACLIHRRVFEAMLGDNDPEMFEWFYYPRHDHASEDSAFSFEAKAAGFRIGATTAVRAGHLSEVTTGWDTYQEYLEASGTLRSIERHQILAKLIAEFTGEDVNIVASKSRQGASLTRDVWRRDNPQTPAEVRAFYGAVDNGYLYDLLGWNSGDAYEALLTPLRSIHGCRVLVVGAGLGSEVEALHHNNEVEVYELPGVLRDFFLFRLNHPDGGLDWGHPVTVLYGTRLSKAVALLPDGYFDWVVALDVVEHIHPDEFEETMDALARVGRRFYLHNNFGQRDIMPQHYDHNARFAAWVERHNLKQAAPIVWERPVELQEEADEVEMRG